MSFTFLVLIVSFFIFSYVVYLFSHDDFVILRSNTSMDSIFNAIFLVSLFSLFCSRFFYVFLNPKPVFLNPLGFVVFPYFPGLSITGALLGGYFISLFILDSWKLPIGRIMDFFSIGFMSAFPLGFIGYWLISREKISLAFYISIILYIIVLFIFIKFIFPLSSGGRLKDGSLSLLFMIFFPLVYLLSNIILVSGKIILTSENLISFLIILSFIAVFVKKENTVEKFLQKK